MAIRNANAVLSSFQNCFGLHVNRRLLVTIAAVGSITMAGVAKAADMPVKSVADAGAPIPSAYNWTGFYIGANVGYAVSNTDVVSSPSPNFLTINPSPQMFNFIKANGTNTLNPSASNGGLQAGYKAQIGAVVVGAEADWTYLGLKKSTSTGALPMPDPTSTMVFSQSMSITQMVTARGMLGAAVGSFLAYVTGGLGVGWDQFSQMVQVPTMPGPCFCWSGQAAGPHAGWVVGAGIQYAINARVSVKTEYLYIDLGSLQFMTSGAPIGNPGLDFTHSARITSETVKVGLELRL